MLAVHSMQLQKNRDNKSLSKVLWIQMHENRKKNLPDSLADSCKHSSVNQTAAGSRLPRSSQSFFLTSQTHFVQLIKPSQVLYKTYWYTGSAFTS